MMGGRQPTSATSDFLAMVRATRELHRLSARGQDDSLEADTVRDASDSVWRSLSETDRERIRGLSDDLYSIIEPGPDPLLMTPEAQAALVDVSEARQRREWDVALDLVRKWRAYFDPALVSYLRGAIWLEAGDPATASLFLKHASDLQANNKKFKALLKLSSSATEGAVPHIPTSS